MAIDVKNLSFGYGDGLTLRDITFRASKGKFTVLLGKNGSGKSTLLKLIAGMLPYRHGTIEILGKDLTHLSPSARAGLIGYLPQFHSPVFPFTVEEVVLTGRASYVFSIPGRKDIDKADAAIDKVGIHHLRRKSYTELSGGERQLVMIARVLAQEPDVIVFDEPLSHLDLSNQSRLLSLIRDLVASGMTVMAVIHDPNAAFLFADDIMFIKEGRLRNMQGDTKPWDRELLRDVYDTEVETVSFRDRALVILS
jgi:iron complex transport system ATP-binding protein